MNLMEMAKCLLLLKFVGGAKGSCTVHSVNLILGDRVHGFLGEFYGFFREIWEDLM